MSQQELPGSFLGHCPFCGKTGMMEPEQDYECHKCGFRFRIAPWAEQEVPAR